MKYLSNNKDIIYTQDSISNNINNDFLIWNIKNNFKCKKIDNLYKFDFNNTIIYNYEKKELIVKKNNDIISSYLEKINNYLKSHNLDLIKTLNYIVCTCNDNIISNYIDENLEQFKILQNIKEINEKNNKLQISNLYVIDNFLYKFNINIYEFTNNLIFKNLIDQNKLDSVLIDVQCFLDDYNEFYALFKFHNIKLKKNIFDKEIKYSNLDELIKNIYNLLDNEDFIENYDNKNNLELIKQTNSLFSLKQIIDFNILEEIIIYEILNEFKNINLIDNNLLKVYIDKLKNKLKKDEDIDQNLFELVNNLEKKNENKIIYDIIET